VDKPRHNEIYEDVPADEAIELWVKDRQDYWAFDFNLAEAEDH
jgi:hypothetical protein